MSTVAVEDGYIVGWVGGRQQECEHCGEKTVCVEIAGVVLPKGVTVKATILQNRFIEEPTCITYIGVGCGCYAKFHRQIAHINDHRLNAGVAL